MPLSDNDLREVQGRVLRMFMDTIATVETIARQADAIYGDRAADVRAAITEYLDDFLRHTEASGEQHPEQLIYETPRQRFQRAGLYGMQLDIKERQVSRVNATLRERLAGGVRRLWQQPFRKWIDVINNFLGSLAPATGMGEALRELKDCLRDELPDEDDEAQA
ncbi:MAG: hypothetical protein Q8M93_17630 [Polaromonas sp.]|uniref:hypothetical protein n=1 Tax=Polaromonas sp. TaxID=1869339 RepID=UPI0027305DCF|nr:hypothetical protein [Polaromonas sp.]MDP2449666.1 hypothetical protein [Polaromonas sp.]MDP3248768.1 hypothetical protein [Polaromonas sp.]MDP3755390.1 hypothetical protein [Polaromonas sp.]MDP3826403.1 hypothetical protein [Polaromonas sp.]